MIYYRCVLREIFLDGRNCWQTAKHYFKINRMNDNNIYCACDKCYDKVVGCFLDVGIQTAIAQDYEEFLAIREVMEP